MSAVAPVSPTQASAQDWRVRTIVLVLAAAVGAWFVYGYALPYLVPDPVHAARYAAARRPLLLLHIGCGTLALLLGPLQLWLGLGQRSLGLHRRLGVAYAASVAAGSLAAFALAARTELGFVVALGLTGLGVAWLSTTALAVAAVRRGRIAQHREWMIRSYVVTFAFVTFRAFWGLLDAMGVGTLPEQLAAASWFCWALPLLLTELVLQGRKIVLVQAD